jgi:DNA modification methylase
MSMAPGSIRDAITGYLAALGREASLAEITAAVNARLGHVPQSSIRSYLNQNVPAVFNRAGRGCYKLTTCDADTDAIAGIEPVFSQGQSHLYHADCFEWLRSQKPSSMHAVVTDPPYGLLEYSTKEQGKLRAGRGGVWRIPPSYDGHQRAPLPRFTILKSEDLIALGAFFYRLAVQLVRVLVPGANVLVASNPILSHIVTTAMAQGGLEVRGTVIRLTMTMRGGDRPKNAHAEFDQVSVMPRSMWEPWVVLRCPIEGRVQDNLRKWGTGGFRRLSADRPFGDVIRSFPTSRAERAIAPHPSLKPQDFLRQIVRASLPLQQGIVLDPFAGSGSTLAAANFVGYQSIGVESDEKFTELAKRAIPALGALKPVDPSNFQFLRSLPVKSRAAGAQQLPGIVPEITEFDFG